MSALRWLLVFALVFGAARATAQEAEAEAEAEAEEEAEAEAAPEAEAAAEAGEGEGEGEGEGAGAGAGEGDGEGEGEADAASAARVDALHLSDREAARAAAIERRSACLRTARAVGPSQAGFLDGMLGVPRRACLRSEVTLAADAYVVARPADFYGNIRIGARLSGSAALTDQIEVFASFEVFRYQSLISAVSSSYLGLGYLSLGSTVLHLDESDVAWSSYLRTVLPTTTGLDQGALPLALELGTTALWAAHPNFHTHGWLSLIGSFAVSQLGAALPRGGVRVGVGLDWIPWEWLSIMLEIQSGFGYRDGLDYLALSGGARLALGDVIGIDLNVIWPFAGAEPALLGGQLGISGRID